MVEWRYLYGRNVKHALWEDDLSYAYPHAICGVHTDWSYGWHGAGDQEEYERVTRLAPCKRCESLLSHPL